MLQALKIIDNGLHVLDGILAPLLWTYRTIVHDHTIDQFHSRMTVNRLNVIRRGIPDGLAWLPHQIHKVSLGCTRSLNGGWNLFDKEVGNNAGKKRSRTECN